MDHIDMLGSRLRTEGEQNAVAVVEFDSVTDVKNKTAKTGVPTPFHAVDRRFNFHVL